MSDIVGSTLRIRIGGSFIWPPVSIDVSSLSKVIFIASGMGINPIISMLSWLHDQKNLRFDVEVLYSIRWDNNGPIHGEGLLFSARLVRMFEGIGKADGAEGFSDVRKLPGRLRLFLTNSGLPPGRHAIPYPRIGEGFKASCELRRMTREDVAEAVGADKGDALVYVCGVPAMTDEFVQYLTSQDGAGMDMDRVLFERWW